MGGMEDLGAMVRRARLARGMRGSDLGAAIGKDASYVSRLENGDLKDVPAPEVLAALSAALGLPELAMLRAIGYLRDAPDQPDAGEPADFADVAAALLEVKDKGMRRRIIEGVVYAWLDEDRERYVVMPPNEANNARHPVAAAT